MIAYKAFGKGLVCLGYKFKMGLNVTSKANCCENGFHCAANPLDCLTYYPNIDSAEYYIVNAGGDIDEDDCDSKIACTELTIIKRLTREEFFLHSLAYIADHPQQEKHRHAQEGQAEAERGYAVAYGADPIAKGKLGNVLAFAKEDPISGKIIQIAFSRIDGETLLPGIWYDSDLNERSAV